jgi:hypothetical protein
MAEVPVSFTVPVAPDEAASRALRRAGIRTLVLGPGRSLHQNVIGHKRRRAAPERAPVRRSHRGFARAGRDPGPIVEGEPAVTG